MYIRSILIVKAPSLHIKTHCAGACGHPRNVIIYINMLKKELKLDSYISIRY